MISTDNSKTFLKKEHDYNLYNYCVEKTYPQFEKI